MTEEEQMAYAIQMSMQGGEDQGKSKEMTQLVFFCW